MTAARITSLRRFLPGHDLVCLGTVPACYHCHHFNLFLDQTVDDTLGPEEGTRLRFVAAREAFGDLLAEQCAQVSDVEERIALATDLFRAMGHGRLSLNGDGDQGAATGTNLHYSRSWQEKYGRLVHRAHPADAVACGFGAAALEVAHDIERGTVRGDETRCMAMRAPECLFKYERADRAVASSKKVDEQACLATAKPVIEGIAEAEVTAVSQELRNYLAATHGDERGLVQGFGVYLTLHLTNYYNRICFDAISHIEERAPRALGVLETLLRESGHVCVFNTFAGVLLSPEWEGLVGEVRNDPLEIVKGCLAVGRTLGFGHWVLHDIEHSRRVVLRTSSSYEASYHLTRFGVGHRAKEYFFQGAALAIAQLAHRVDFEAKPVLSQRYYNDLFRGGVPWRADQTRSLICGDELSEVVVSRVG